MKITINNQDVECTDGTILDAARQLGIEIPTMCHHHGYPHYTSCMVCQVKNVKTGALLPSCSIPAHDGMVIDTLCEEAQEARKAAIELLLSEHLGDCEGPCTVYCPANMDIPKMIRQIAAGQNADALQTVKESIVLPAVLGRICSAPCEKACRRAAQDDAVAICKLKQHVADVDLDTEQSWLPDIASATGKRVAIVGAGPAGLAAAWHLLQKGHACALFDRHEKPGGALQYETPEERLERTVLDREIELVLELGAEFKGETDIGSDITMEDLSAEYDAVVLVVGGVSLDELDRFGVKLSKIGFDTNRATYQTSLPKVFAWKSKANSKMAIRAVGAGKEIAESVHQFLSGDEVIGAKQEFNSAIGKLLDGEARAFMANAAEDSRQAESVVLSLDGAVAEAKRCMHCDCLAQHDCMLRDLSTAMSAKQKRFAPLSRVEFRQHRPAGKVILESGKCINCGICVRICEEADVKDGFTFTDRGYDVVIGTPFDGKISDEHLPIVMQCVEACPTGSLSLDPQSIN